MLPEEIRAFNSVYSTLLPVQDQLSSDIYRGVVSASAVELQRFQAKQAVKALSEADRFDIKKK